MTASSNKQLVTSEARAGGYNYIGDCCSMYYLGQFILKLIFLQINCTLYNSTIWSILNSQFFVCILDFSILGLLVLSVLYWLPGLTILSHYTRINWLFCIV